MPPSLFVSIFFKCPGTLNEVTVDADSTDTGDWGRLPVATITVKVLKTRTTKEPERGGGLFLGGHVFGRGLLAVAQMKSIYLTSIQILFHGGGLAQKKEGEGFIRKREDCGRHVTTFARAEI